MAIRRVLAYLLIAALGAAAGVGGMYLTAPPDVAAVNAAQLERAYMAGLIDGWNQCVKQFPVGRGRVPLPPE